MNAKAKRYYTLFVWTGRWTPEFGDYSRAVVLAEKREWREAGTKGPYLRVVQHLDTKASLEVELAKLNK